MTIALRRTCAEKNESQQAPIASWSRATTSEVHKRNTPRIHGTSVN